ncbi:hypothetical protein HY256_07635 [Candidatus Sumerlaeota bacterium]|nr:hypothetical protein [Candidatus Sumerlaeota bacterium]
MKPPRPLDSTGGEQDSDVQPSAPWVSRILVLALLGWIGGFAVLSYIKSLSPPPESKAIVSPFKPWDGVWEGDLVTVGPDGREVHHVHLKQEFRHVVSDTGFRSRAGDDKVFRQEGHFEATDTATGKKDHEAEMKTSDAEMKILRSRVIRKKGQEVIYREGRIEGGGIVWNCSMPNARETFREWIEGDVYHLEGEAAYGNSSTTQPLHLKGEFRRVEAGNREFK